MRYSGLYLNDCTISAGWIAFPDLCYNRINQAKRITEYFIVIWSRGAMLSIHGKRQSEISTTLQTKTGYKFR